jgi:uncharacterized protein (TIGR02117 family)
MRVIKKISVTILKSILIFVGIVLLFWIAEKILSNCLINKNQTTKSEQIPLYIKSNGVHTDLVFPKNSTIINWDTVFPIANNKLPNSSLSFIAIGWGDKGFYLNTPEWKDLKFSTAFNAMFGLSTTALHITYYANVDTNELTKLTYISASQYKDLIDYILKNTSIHNNQAILINTSAQYGNNDAFYEAEGTYSLFITCNTWTNNALKSAGLKACVWTAFDKGIINAYK